ncbi:MAG TPA: hypothetical protein VLN49_24580 [Gemmatimonadaceae bacterium]|nr:hypothetical protein [Gemmatimonadaceae bacterium]
MIGFLRDSRLSRGRLVRLALALLAFVGTQAVFVRAAFPHVVRSTAVRMIDQNSDAQSQSSVDEGRLPSRGSRRGGPTVGPSAPSAPQAIESVMDTRSARIVTSGDAPPAFVPPPLFHPPRAR